VNDKRPRGLSLVAKKSIVIGGHPTSVSLESAFWDALKEIAAYKGLSPAELITTIDIDRTERRHGNLSSAIRLFVVDHYRRMGQPSVRRNNGGAKVSAAR
jgi:predicted DNA-binding ribbon-helix-helix protein